MISLILIVSVFGKCSTIKYRKSILDMTEMEIRTWQNGHLALYKSGKLQEMTAIHGTAKTIHQDAHLWAWHREFLNWYEEELLAVDPEVILPYFPWIYDAEAPELSKVWEDDILGSSQVTWDPSTQTYQAVCIPSGPFKGLIDNQGLCVQRQFDKSGKTGYPQDLLWKIGKAPTNPVDLKIKLYGVSSYEQWISTSNPTQFVSLLSTPHFLVHLFVGGSQRFFKSSCFDGLFWNHHTFMDSVLQDWLDSNPNMVDQWPESDWVLEHFQITTREVLKKDYCVRYIKPINKGSTSQFTNANTNQKSQQNDYRVIPSIPENRIISMGMDPAVVQKSYDENRKIILITDIKKKYSGPSYKNDIHDTAGINTIIDGVVSALNLKLGDSDIALIKNVAKGLSIGSIAGFIKDFSDAINVSGPSDYPKDNSTDSEEFTSASGMRNDNLEMSSCNMLQNAAFISVIFYIL
eukprot:NODE_136_length_18060_cov_0.656645.p2 type:complete len:462 gc:universal NODE_136_length_18060_cov_0.656645:10268-11653(+)